MTNEQYFTSESVTEGHPDKVCDYISDSILDACLEKDPHSRVACEALCKGDTVVLAGEISCAEAIDFAAVTRQAIAEIGYTDPSEPFNAEGVKIQTLITRQCSEIAKGVDAATNVDHDQGAGDQGIMFGYASWHGGDLMPLPIRLAHALTRQLAQDRKSGEVDWLLPDGKAQVTVRHEDGVPMEVTSVLVSTQHRDGIKQQVIEDYVRNRLIPQAIDTYCRGDNMRVLVNPTGSFVQGGPSVDCGLTGRKIIADTYGGVCRHGGGAFSGKDPSKVDRSAAYFCRYVARQLVRLGYARRVELQVAYAIGKPGLESIYLDTQGTGDPRAALEYVTKEFDFRPAAIIERLGLLRPIYRQTTNYGHFGRPGLPWEAESGNDIDVAKKVKRTMVTGMREREFPPMEACGREMFTAKVIRKLLWYAAEDKAFDRWAEFPQERCAATLKKNGRTYGICAGAVLDMWKYGKLPVVQECWECGENAYLVSFSGGLSTGGGRLVCAGCGRVYFQWMGGAAAIMDILDSTPLQTSAYRPNGFGNGCPSNGEYLAQQLRIEDVPDPLPLRTEPRYVWSRDRVGGFEIQMKNEAGSAVTRVMIQDKADCYAFDDDAGSWVADEDCPGAPELAGGDLAALELFLRNRAEQRREWYGTKRSPDGQSPRTTENIDANDREVTSE